MKKYWTIFRVELENTMAFRGPALIWMIFDLLWISIFPFVWINVVQSGAGSETATAWDAKRIINYFVFMALLHNLIFMHPEVHVGDEIYDGKLSNFLSKPQSYLVQAFLHEAAWKVVRTFLFAPFFIVIVLGFRSYLSFTLGPHIGALVLALALALIIFFLTALCIGFVCFWFEEPYPSRALFWITSGIFGGQYFPLDFLPNIFQRIADILPFKYSIYFPLQLFTGEVTQSVLYSGFIGQFIWLMLLFVIVTLLWRQGLKAYSAVGR